MATKIPAIKITDSVLTKDEVKVSKISDPKAVSFLIADFLNVTNLQEPECDKRYYLAFHQLCRPDLTSHDVHKLFIPNDTLKVKLAVTNDHPYEMFETTDEAFHTEHLNKKWYQIIHKMDIAQCLGFLNFVLEIPFKQTSDANKAHLEKRFSACMRMTTVGPNQPILGDLVNIDHMAKFCTIMNSKFQKSENIKVFILEHYLTQVKKTTSVYVKIARYYLGMLKFHDMTHVKHIIKHIGMHDRQNEILKEPVLAGESGLVRILMGQFIQGGEDFFYKKIRDPTANIVSSTDVINCQYFSVLAMNKVNESTTTNYISRKPPPGQASQIARLVEKYYGNIGISDNTTHNTLPGFTVPVATTI